MVLASLFGAIAFLYAIVGFGGGSSYLALLVLWSLPYTIIPILALACNIIVVSGNSFQYVRAGHFNKRLLLPYLISSIPLAYLGGTVPISQLFFEWLVFITLLLAGLLLLWQHKEYGTLNTTYRSLSLPFAIGVGAVLGFLSGIIGIGGGIFLAPVLYILHAGSPRQIATTASLFILFNSIAGILGHLQKSGLSDELFAYWPLLLAVLVGGLGGNLVSLKYLSLKVMVFITGLLVLFVSFRIGVRVTGLL